MKRIFFIVLTVYITCAAGYLDTIDVRPSLETARSLIEHQTFVTHPPEDDEWLYKPASDGKYYSKMGLTMPLLYIPCVGLGRLASRLFKISSQLAEEFLVSLVNAVVTAFTVSLIYFFLVNAGTDRLTSTIISFGFAFASYLFVYMKTCHREPFEAMCMMGVLAFSQKKEKKFLILSGASVGLLFLTKLPLIVVALPAVVWVMKKRSKSDWPYFLVPIVFSACVWFLFSKFAYGSFFDTGYNPANVLTSKSWNTNFCRGMYLQMLSFSSGFIVYNPAVLLLFFRRTKLDALDWVALQCFFLELVLHAKWFNPLGGDALGPRYMVAVTPLIAVLFRGVSVPRFTPSKKAALAVCLIVCTFYQLINVSVKSQEYWTLNSRLDQPIPISHWRANFIFFAHKLFYRREEYSLKDLGFNEDIRVSLEDARSLRGFNFWWLQAPKVKWGTMR